MVGYRQRKHVTVAKYLVRIAPWRGDEMCWEYLSISCNWLENQNMLVDISGYLKFLAKFPARN